jgi:DNA-binding XRE family transcriptional regulator
MKATKRSRLEAAGWAVGSTAQFLSLPPEERAFVEMKVSLSRSLREWRTRNRLTQSTLARRLHSSQSRIAKMEAADPTVSVDLLLRSLLRLGAKPRDIARAIA